MEHWVLYEDDLKRIYTFQEKRVLLNEVLLEYSPDLTGRYGSAVSVTK